MPDYVVKEVRIPLFPENTQWYPDRRKRKHFRGIDEQDVHPQGPVNTECQGVEGSATDRSGEKNTRQSITPGETGMSLNWLSTVLSEFSKYTMVYREGSYARKKWAPPDVHPLVIKTVDGKTKFNLSHMVCNKTYDRTSRGRCLCMWGEKVFVRFEQTPEFGD